MPFIPGDLVHVAGLGKGTVREVRNGQRYLVDLKGRSLVASEDQLTVQEESKRKSARSTRSVTGAPRDYDEDGGEPASLDLHGHTVAEAMEAVTSFLNGALLGGSSGVKIIHGRGGGKIKAALHAQLGRIPSIRSFRLDPRNAGVTIVEF